MYRAMPSEGSIAWVDISVTGYVPPAGTSQAALMRRFHTVTPAGVLLSGASAFVHVWSLLPGWRHLARMARLPGVTPLMEMTYRLFLHLRPWMQSAYRRLV